MQRLEIVVEGRVQGVWFRASTKEAADEVGAAGTVRNLPGGDRVEIVVEGTPEQVQHVLDFVRRGPPEARVDRVEAREAEPRQLQGFVILR
jgi:acylphosphatase